MKTATPRDHILAFFDAFLQDSRRERWIYLFENDQEKLRRNSSKLLHDLNSECLVEDKHLRAILNHDVQGVFYDIGRKEASWQNLEQVLERQPHFDAIFSIEPGKLAVFLFHEGQRYVLSA
jgi:lipoprotein NlpI